MNPYVGDMPVDIAGERLTLAYDWKALARIRAELGAEGQTEALSGNPEKLGLLVSIGLERHHPEWTPDKVLKASPFVIPMVKAVEQALVVSFFGPEGVPKEEENPQMPPQTRLNRLWRRLLKRE